MGIDSTLMTPQGWSATHTGCGEVTFTRREGGVHARIEPSRSIMGGFRCIVEQASDGVRLVDRHEQFATLGAAVERAEAALADPPEAVT